MDIDDSEAVIRAIEMTGDDVPIDLVLHTPGGLVLAAEQIASALVDHKGEVSVYVPHYAMSGGTLIALAADRIVMAPSAVLGPVDPQVGDLPAASILAAVDKKDVNETDDRTLILADVARKAQTQVRHSVSRLLRRHMSEERAGEVATALSDGRWTHDLPIDAELATSLGLPVSTELPDEVRKLMGLYPNHGDGGHRSSTSPAPYDVPARPEAPRRLPGRRSRGERG